MTPPSCVSPAASNHSLATLDSSAYPLPVYTSTTPTQTAMFSMLPTLFVLHLATASASGDGLTLLQQEEEEEDAELDFLKPSDKPVVDDKIDANLFTEEEDVGPQWEFEGSFYDEGGEDPVEESDRFERPEAPTPQAGPLQGLGLDIAGKLPLTGSFPLNVVAKDLDAVAIELPVLVAMSRGDLTGDDFWLVAETYVDDRRTGEQRHLVTGSSLAELGPTVVWFKGLAPVAATNGIVEIRVSRTVADSPDVQLLFSKRANYAL